MAELGFQPTSGLNPMLLLLYHVALYCKRYSFSDSRSAVLGAEDITNKTKPLILWSSHSNWGDKK